MKSDVNGCSTCPPGEERYERFWSPVLRKHLIQYDHRLPDGRLFSTVATSLEICRERFHRWLETREEVA